MGRMSKRSLVQRASKVSIARRGVQSAGQKLNRNGLPRVRQPGFENGEYVPFEDASQVSMGMFLEFLL